MNDPTLHQTLRAFRAEMYAALGARRDALFEILDAATTVGPVPSLPYLSLTALHRRGWGSLYAAPARGQPLRAPGRGQPGRGRAADPRGPAPAGRRAADLCVGYQRLAAQ